MGTPKVKFLVLFRYDTLRYSKSIHFDKRFFLYDHGYQTGISCIVDLSINILIKKSSPITYHHPINFFFIVKGNVFLNIPVVYRICFITIDKIINNLIHTKNKPQNHHLYPHYYYLNKIYFLNFI